MNIDFSSIEERLIPQPRGGEGTMGSRQFADGDNRLLKARLLPGSRIGFHRHETDSETLLVLSGTGKMVTEQGEEPVRPGSVQYCPRGAAHSLVNDGTEDLVFFAVIPQHAQ
jgi:quercetin dioxygenase-like cupin family protein